MRSDSPELIAELERRIADLRARLPRHSVPAAMLIELEELESELDEAQAAVQNTGERRLWARARWSP